MKKIKLILVIAITLFAVTSFAANKQTATILVNGNCDMCKSRIETASKKAGATNVFWNEKSHQLKLEFDADKTSLTKIEECILKAGYDTEKLKATDKAYKSLPTCCQYERE